MTTRTTDMSRCFSTLFSFLARCGLLLLLSTSIGYAQPFAYVTNFNSNNVSVVDVAINTVSATIPVGTNPHGVGITPDGSRIYITNQGSANVSVIDGFNNTVIATVPVGGFPRGAAATPDGSRVYITSQDIDAVSVIDVASNTVTATIPVGQDPQGVVVTPDGSRVYVVNTSSNNVSVIDVASNTVSATVTVGTSPQGVTITPDGSRAYVANYNNTVSVIDIASNAVTATVTGVGSQSTGLSVTPDGSRVYVANAGGQSVSVIDVASNTVTATITVGISPQGVSITPDGNHAYVTNSNSNNVSVIEVASNTVTATVSVGTTPVSFGDFITFPPPPSPARDFYVKATGGNDSNTGADFDNAYATFQKALEEAERTLPGSKIFVAAGTYKPSRAFDFFSGVPSGTSSQQLRTFYIPSGTEVYGGFPAGATGTADAAAIAARDFTANTTILSGDFNDDDQVTGSGQTLSITQTSDNAYHVVYTRAVSNTTVVDGFTIQGGSTAGGAINQGGGWYNDGQQNRGASSPTVRNCRFFGNVAPNGAAMANAGFSGGEVNPIIENCTFDRNSGANGAGVYITVNSGTTTARITNCVFSGGRAAGGDGGGIHVRAGSGTSDVQVVNSLFSGNSANQGAAAYHTQSTGSYINCTFANNSSSGQALLNSGGTVSVQNSIFWQNLNSSNAESSIDNSAPGTTTVTHTLVGEADETAFIGGSTGLTPGTGMIYGQDPLFTNAASGTLTLQGGSPAIDAGNSAAVPSGVTVDLAGNVRTQGSAVDMGAYEREQLPEITLTASSDVNENAAMASITFTFSASLSPSSSLTVNFSVSGTATFNDDYTLTSGSSDFNGTTGTVTIPSGQTTTQLVFAVQPDAIYEEDETIIVTIQQP